MGHEPPGLRGQLLPLPSSPLLRYATLRLLGESDITKSATKPATFPPASGFDLYVPALLHDVVRLNGHQHE